MDALEVARNFTMGTEFNSGADCLFSTTCIHCLDLVTCHCKTKPYGDEKLLPPLDKLSMAPGTNEVLLSSPYQSDVNISTTEMHTGGMPVRIIEAGFPVPQGENIKAKVEDLKKNYDDYRKLVIHEPHGHQDMYGVLLVAPDNPEADVGAIFMDNQFYATMCGHATISLARYALDRGLVRRRITAPETQVNIQAPCGLVKAFVQVSHGDTVKSGRTRFESVPAFVVATDVEVDVEGFGKITIDVSYGGSFYAFVTASDVDIDFSTVSGQDLIRAGRAIKAAAMATIPISHPHTTAFYYGTMIVDSRTSKASPASTNVCIFADGATDRSPCGSGTTARIALMYHRGLLGLGQKHTFRCGVTGSEFTGCPIRETELAGKKAIVVEISGQGRYIGKSTLTLEKEDMIGRGFQIR